MEPTLYNEAVQGQLATLITVCWIVLIPVGVLLAIVLFKLAFLIHTVSEFMGLARYELYPLLQLVQNTANNLDILSTKVVSGVESVEKGLHTAAPGVKKGIDSVRGKVDDVRDRAGAVARSFARIFSKNSPAGSPTP